MGRHRHDRAPRSIWEILREAGFYAVMVALAGLFALILGVAIGLRWLG